MADEEWQWRQLSDVSTVSSGGTPSKKVAEYWEGGNVPWIRTTEVQNCVLGINDVVEYITGEGLENSSAKLVPAGTLLLAMIGQGKTRGQIALLTFSASTNQNCATIVLKKCQSPVFYFNYLKSQYENIRRLSNSAGQSNLSGSLVKSIKVPVPPLPEQKKIAQMLSTWDKAITTTEKLFANSQQHKKALMQQLLTGKKRLLDKNGVRFSGEWVEKKLKDVIVIHYGKSPKEVIRDNGKVPIYGTGGIGGYAHKALCDTEAVLIGRKGTIDNPKFISVPFWPIDTTFYCTASDSVSIKWFYYVSTAIALRKYVEASGVPSLSRDTLYSIKIKCPSQIAEQEAIASSLDACEDNIERYLSLIDAFVNEKKALMQQLLTGKRRVKTDEVLA